MCNTNDKSDQVHLSVPTMNVASWANDYIILYISRFNSFPLDLWESRCPRFLYFHWRTAFDRNTYIHTYSFFKIPWLFPEIQRKAFEMKALYFFTEVIRSRGQREPFELEACTYSSLNIAMIIPRDYFKQILSTQKHSFCLIPSTPRAKNTVKYRVL